MQGVGHKSMLCTVVPYNPTMLNYLVSILWKTICLPIISYAYVPTYIIVFSFAYLLSYTYIPMICSVLCLLLVLIAMPILMYIYSLLCMHGAYTLTHLHLYLYSFSFGYLVSSYIVYSYTPTYIVFFVYIASYPI